MTAGKLKARFGTFFIHTTYTRSGRHMLDYIRQACTTYGPRAKCGPQKLLIWPAKSNILGFKLVFLINVPFEWVITYHLGPWAWNFFWPAMRFELCTPDIG